MTPSELGDAQRARGAPATAGPSYVGVPTDLLASQCRDARHHGRAAARRRRAGRAGRPGPAPRAAERPLVWAGAGAATAVHAVAARRAARRAGAHHVQRTRRAPADHPSPVGMPPHVEPAGACGTSRLRDRLRHRPRRHEHAELAAAAAAADVAINVDAADAGEELRRRRGPRRARRRAEPAARRRHRRRTRAVLAEACRGSTRARCASSTPSSTRCPTTTSCATCASPATGSRASTARPPAQAALPDGLGHARFAFPAALGAALAGTGPTVSIFGDGGFLFACGELATWRRSAPAHRRARRRRRLRDAALRPGARRRGADGVELSTLTSPRWPRVSASAPRRSRASTTVRRGARAACGGSGAERAGGEGGGAGPAADHVAELVPAVTLAQGARFRCGCSPRGRNPRPNRTRAPYCLPQFRTAPDFTSPRMRRSRSTLRGARLRQ